jgi:hypothetical protein
METTMLRTTPKRAAVGDKIAHQSAPQSKIGMNSVISNLFASGC